MRNLGELVNSCLQGLSYQEGIATHQGWEALLMEEGICPDLQETILSASFSSHLGFDTSWVNGVVFSKQDKCDPLYLRFICNKHC